MKRKEKIEIALKVRQLILNQLPLCDRLDDKVRFTLIRYLVCFKSPEINDLYKKYTYDNCHRIRYNLWEYDRLKKLLIASKVFKQIDRFNYQFI